MKKVFSALLLFFLAFVVVGCKPQEEEVERTYKTDGVYVAWSLDTSTSDLLLPDGTKYMNPSEATVKVNVPVLTLVKVEIRDDKIVDFYIDELQSKAVASTVDENGFVDKVDFAFNAQTKKELEYGYGMEQRAAMGEWFIQATIMENNWLASGDVEALASITITQDEYVALAEEAVQKAKDGKASAVYATGYTVHFVEADVDENGKLGDVTLNAHYFNYIDKSTAQYDETAAATYLVFDWDAETKYEGYGEMAPGKTWQAMIDSLTDYINENGWDGSLTSGSTINEAYSAKGVNINGENVDTLSSVTITVSNEVLVMNMLWKFFPFGWTE